MQKFGRLTARAVALSRANVDTDLLIPSQYLVTTHKTGLGAHLLEPLRRSPDGSPDLDFILNRPAGHAAEILVGLENFGCGSSREHASWALLDYGFRCVIAPSFSDIFYANSLRCGLLPVRLTRKWCESLIEDAIRDGSTMLTVDLEQQIVLRPGGERATFEIDSLRKGMLTAGVDEIGHTLRLEAAIAQFETRQSVLTAWLPADRLLAGGGLPSGGGA